MDHQPKYKCKARNRIGENTNFPDVGLGKEFSDKTPKA